MMRVKLVGMDPLNNEFVVVHTIQAPDQRTYLVRLSDLCDDPIEDVMKYIPNATWEMNFLYFNYN